MLNNLNEESREWYQQAAHCARVRRPAAWSTRGRRIAAPCLMATRADKGPREKNGCE
jgi:hypothetical protein